MKHFKKNEQARVFCEDKALRKAENYLSKKQISEVQNFVDLKLKAHEFCSNEGFFYLRIKKRTRIFKGLTEKQKGKIAIFAHDWAWARVVP